MFDRALNILDNEFRLHHIQVEKRFADDIKPGLMDENQLQQLFVNLLLNAVQAIENHGKITITTRRLPNGEGAEIEIADNGGGIADDQVHKIFEPFFSTKKNGTGLGLAVSYGIVASHQGKIKVHSKPGKGTRFIFTLPIRQSEV